jgi:predicted ATPase
MGENLKFRVLPSMSVPIDDQSVWDEILMTSAAREHQNTQKQKLYFFDSFCFFLLRLVRCNEPLNNNNNNNNNNNSLNNSLNKKH